jgi:periplasmic protein TonB
VSVSLLVKTIVFLLIAAGAVLSQEVSSTAAPTVVRKIEPEYTKKALDAKIQGTVVLSLVITADGVPSEIKLVRGLGSGLDEKAVECLQQRRFSPAMRNYEPVPTKATVEINFRLPAGASPAN